jgi:8-oxo-dGTP pyrophosphatase MutT (NUDIX family)
MNSRTLDPEHLRSLLLPAEPLLPGQQELQAAVLLLVCAAPQPVTFLTVRSEALPMHPGQISLPGGRLSAMDISLEAAALRETNEETGIDPGSIQVLGRLPQVTVVSSGFVITPVVGWTNKAPKLQADPREVAQIITCPIQELLSPSRYQLEGMERAGMYREYWVIQLGTHRVWGATASILRSLACRLNPSR